MEGVLGYFVRDGLCQSLRRLPGEVARAQAAVSAECSLARVLNEPCSRKGLVSLVSCVGKRMRVYRIHLFDGNAEMMFRKSGFIR